MLHFYFTKVTIYHHYYYHHHNYHHFHHYHYHYNHHHHFHHHYYKYASILLDMIHYTSLIDAENNECLKYHKILRVEGDVVARNNRRSIFSDKISGLSEAKDTITSSSSSSSLSSPSSSLPSSLLLFKDNFKLFNLLLTNYAISLCNDKYSNIKKEASSTSLSSAASATSPMKKEGLLLIQAFLYEVIHNITYDRTSRTLLQYDDEIDWNKPSRVNQNQPASSNIDLNDDDVFEIGSPRHLIEALLTWNITSDRELQQKQRNRSEGKFMTSIAADDDDDDDVNGNDGTNMTSGDINMVRLCVIIWV